LSQEIALDSRAKLSEKYGSAIEPPSEFGPIQFIRVLVYPVMLAQRSASG